ncbi:UNVERIFIED_CONTAM: hypothetical protein FKN15_036611 [Acipenser sinensis]
MTVLIPRWAGPSASSQEGAYRQLWYSELSDTYSMGRHIPFIMLIGGRLLFQGTRVTHILIVQRQLSVIEEEQEEFRLALRQYIESATSQTGCLHHLQTNYSKTFQRSNVDFLETPELMTTMLVPG